MVHPEHIQIAEELRNKPVSEQIKHLSDRLLSAAPNNVWGVSLLEIHKTAVLMESELVRVSLELEELKKKPAKKSEEVLETPKK